MKFSGVQNQQIAFLMTNIIFVVLHEYDVCHQESNLLILYTRKHYSTSTEALNNSTIYQFVFYPKASKRIELKLGCVNMTWRDCYNFRSCSNVCSSNSKTTSLLTFSSVELSPSRFYSACHHSFRLDDTMMPNQNLL